MEMLFTFIQLRAFVRFVLAKEIIYMTLSKASKNDIEAQLKTL